MPFSVKFSPRYITYLPVILEHLLFQKCHLGFKEYDVLHHFAHDLIAGMLNDMMLFFHDRSGNLLSCV